MYVNLILVYLVAGRTLVSNFVGRIILLICQSIFLLIYPSIYFQLICKLSISTLSGSDHSRSQRRPWSGTSVSRIILLICQSVYPTNLSVNLFSINMHIIYLSLPYRDLTTGGRREDLGQGRLLVALSF